jgi:hypothetical protein
MHFVKYLLVVICIYYEQGAPTSQMFLDKYLQQLLKFHYMWNIAMSPPLGSLSELNVLCLLSGLLLDPEGGGSTFLKDISKLPDSMTSQPRR